MIMFDIIIMISDDIHEIAYACMTTISIIHMNLTTIHLHYHYDYSLRLLILQLDYIISSQATVRYLNN